MEKSTCLSADVNAAFDPTYASAFEANNSSYINNGAVITNTQAAAENTAPPMLQRRIYGKDKKDT